MEGAGVDDPVAVEVGGVEGEALVAAAEDGALAFGVDEDEGLGAGCAGDGDDAGFDTGVGEGFAMEGGGEVVAEFADVAGAEAPVLAGDDGGGDLSAGEGADGGVFGLGAAGGVGGERDDGVGGVEADADKVDLRRFRHGFTVNELRWHVGGAFELGLVNRARVTSITGQDLGGGAEDDFVKGVGVERLFGADVDGADAALVGDVDEAGGGVDGAGGADDEEGGGAVEFAVDGVHVEGDFAEPDDVRADGGATGLQVGRCWRFRRRTGRGRVGCSARSGIGRGCRACGGCGWSRRARGGRRRFGCRGRSGRLEVLFDVGEGYVGGVGLGGEGVAAALE